MISARSYQTEAVGSIWNYFQTKRGNPLVAMPTGTGKSVVIAMFLHSVLTAYPTQRIMVLTHVKELIQQNYSKLLSIWPFAPAGVYSAGLGKRDTNAPITFAGIASVAKRWSAFGRVDLVLIDEAHLVSPTEATMYQQFINGLRSINPHVKVIGLTATPWRLGHGHLTDPVVTVKQGKEVETPSLFTDVCFDITGVEAFNRLIAEGYLAPLVPKATATKLDIDGVHMRGGEFIQGELQAAVNRTDITIKAVREALELGHDRMSWLAFAAGVEHAIDTADILNEHGVPSVAIHSKLGDAERDKAIRDFKAGRYRCAVNNNVLTTGFDHPPIDLILGLRPTASAVLWVQMLGRGTRPYDPARPGDVDTTVFNRVKQNCMVLDYAANTRRLGPINDPVVPRRKGKGGGDAPVKECPVCHTYVHASLRWCNGELADGTDCTHEFTFETKLKADASSEQIIKGDMPVVEVFKVDHITFAEHRKDGRPPMVRVSYYCGYRSFEEFVCPEHTNYAGKKARDWWRLRSTQEMPPTTADLLEQADTVKVPTHLRVWVNKKYPEILAACFDGTAFGKEDAPAELVAPSVQTPKDTRAATHRQEAAGSGAKAPAFDDYEDDIPF